MDILFCEFIISSLKQDNNHICNNEGLAYRQTQLVSFAGIQILFCCKLTQLDDICNKKKHLFLRVTRVIVQGAFCDW